MAFLQKKNNVRSTIDMVGGFSDVATTLIVANGGVFPATGDFIITIWDSTTYNRPTLDPDLEILRVTSRSGNSLTVTRAQENTVAIAHTDGESVDMLITAGIFDDAFDQNLKTTDSPTFDYGTTITDGVDSLQINDYTIVGSALAGTKINFLNSSSSLGVNNTLFIHSLIEGDNSNLVMGSEEGDNLLVNSYNAVTNEAGFISVKLDGGTQPFSSFNIATDSFILSSYVTNGFLKLNSSDGVVSVDTTTYLSEETDPVFTSWLSATPPIFNLNGAFLLDQTTPQTVSGGRPTFSNGISMDDDSRVYGELTVERKSGFEITLSPLVIGGINYDQAFGNPTAGSMYMYYGMLTTSPFSPILVEVAPTNEPLFLGSHVTGELDVSVACLMINDGTDTYYVTMYFQSDLILGAVNPSPGTDDLLYLDTWLIASGIPSYSVDYYCKKYMEHNGPTTDFTWFNPDGTSIVSGYWTPPEIRYTSTTEQYVIFDYNGVNVLNGGSYFYDNKEIIKADWTLSNMFFGGAGNKTMTGSQNFAMSQDALVSNTIGEWNTAIGPGTLGRNTQGSWNTAIGKMSLGNNVTGSNNISIGDTALYSNTTGWGNISIGNYAISQNNGGQNVAIGYNAGDSLLTGNGNVFIGAEADIVPGATAIHDAIAIGNGILVGADYAQAFGGQNNVLDGEGSVTLSGDMLLNHGYYCNILSGTNNTITALAQYSTILAGQNNTITGTLSILLGGSNNVMNGDNSVISGGLSDTNDGSRSVISGGQYNTIDDGASDCFVAGGNNNTIGATGSYSNIIGAINSYASDFSSTIIGSTNSNATGSGFIANSQDSTVKGFGALSISNLSANITGTCVGAIESDYVLVVADYSSVIDSMFSSIQPLPGGDPITKAFMANSMYCTISTSSACILSAENSSVHGVGSGVLGGQYNYIDATNSFILGGHDNDETGNLVAIIDSVNCSASGYFSSIYSSYNSDASGEISIILGGQNNMTSGNYTALISSINSEASGESSGIYSSQDSEVSGRAAIIIGGMFDVASGLGSTIISSEYSNAIGDGSFITNSSHCDSAGWGAAIYSSTRVTNNAIFSTCVDSVDSTMHSTAFFSYMANANFCNIYAPRSTVFGGSYHTITNAYNTILGGNFNTITGMYNYALGDGLIMTGNNSFGINLKTYSKGTISAVAFTGTGLNDATSSGTYRGADVSPVTYTVQIVADSPSISPSSSKSPSYSPSVSKSASYSPSSSSSPSTGFSPSGSYSASPSFSPSSSNSPTRSPSSSKSPSSSASPSSAIADRIIYKKNSGAWSLPTDITAATAMELGDGVNITFVSASGHDIGDEWVITVTPVAATVVSDSEAFQVNWNDKYIEMKEKTYSLDFGGGAFDFTIPIITTNTSLLAMPILGIDAKLVVSNSDVANDAVGVNTVSVLNYDSSTLFFSAVDFGIYINGSGSTHGYFNAPIDFFNATTLPTPITYYPIRAGEGTSFGTADTTWTFSTFDLTSIEAGYLPMLVPNGSVVPSMGLISASFIFQMGSVDTGATIYALTDNTIGGKSAAFQYNWADTNDFLTISSSTQIYDSSNLSRDISFVIGASDIENNPLSALFGYVTAAGSAVSIYHQISDTDDFLHLSRGSSSVLGYKVDMPLHLASDTNKLFFGAGNDMAVYYDGTSGHITTNDVAASDLHIQCGTDKTIVLDEVVYDDIIIQAINLRTSGTTPPTVDVFQDSIYGMKFTNAQTDIVYGSFEVPHTYKEGTDLEVHLHWSPSSTNTGSCDWVMKYTFANMAGTFGGEETITFQQAGSGTANKHQYVSGNVVISGSAKSIAIGAIICFALSRPTGDAFTGDAFLHSVGVHYEIDTMGSRQRSVK